MKPPVSTSLLYFHRYGNEPSAAIVIGHNHGHTLDLFVMPQFDRPRPEYCVPFVSEGHNPPRHDSYCAYPRQPTVRTPGNISINVKE